MNQYYIPDGVPALLYVAQVAAVLGYSAVTVGGWARRGKFAVHQLEKGCWRQIPAVEVARVAALLDVEPDWERVFDER